MSPGLGAATQGNVSGVCTTEKGTPSLETESETVRSQTSSSSTDKLESFYSVPRTTFTNSSKTTFSAKNFGGKVVSTSFISKTKFSPLEVLLADEEEDSAEQIEEVPKKSCVEKSQKL